MGVEVHINSQGREVTIKYDPKTGVPKLAPIVDKAFSLWCATAPTHNPTGFGAGTYADTQAVETTLGG